MAPDRSPHPKPRVIPPLPAWPRREAAILAEVTDPAVAAELWLQLRHARDWLEAHEDAAELFPARPTARVLDRRAQALEAAAELEDALAAFHALTDAPGEATPGALAAACVAVADWASGSGCGATAAQFAAAAVRADPASPACHNVAGLAHRKEGDWRAAELYYLRAAHLAREQRDADERVAAHIGLAALWFSRGHPRRARRHLDTATNAATRSGSLWLAGHAQHDLMLMMTECGEYRHAEAAATRAVSLYPLNDPRLPYLAADFAFLQIAQHLYAESVPILERFTGLVAEPAQQVIGLGLLARAYAGAGRGDDYRRTRDRAAALLSLYPQDAPAAFYHLAEAALSLGAWDEARDFAGRSLDGAEERGDASVAAHAWALLGRIEGRQLPAPAPVPEGAGARRATAHALAIRLARWNPAARRGRRRTPRRNHWAA